MRQADVPTNEPIPSPLDANVPAVQSFRFSTLDERPEHQFDAWHAAMVRSIQVERPASERNNTGFAATLEAWDIGGIALGSMSLPGEGFARRWSHNPRAELDHWSLVVPIADGSGMAYRRRPLSFGSLARPLAGTVSDTRVVSLFVPRDLFRDNPGVFDLLDPDVADQGLNALLADFVVSLGNRLGAHADQLNPAQVRDALRAMILSCLSTTPGNIEDARDLLRAGLTERIKRHIRENLTSPTLDAGELCQRFGISRATLYRLFEPLGGIATFVRREKLEAARLELGQAEGGPTIVSLATRYGFSDASAFTRAFRQTFGLPPSELREAMEIGATPLPASIDFGEFDRFLKTLHR
ncbi:hypothetical protein C3941_10555 [Kaistia algarum]|uniref:AraC family transcriptional regulator n=1 Tax=Kaistia algarum TaxID=2083279 RepID=UPI000CE88D6C|nr:AraC family transcriptional regulator [Kaistia algarum]MCX5514791.1 AraC family transcriptional regulator [Kaistia algarum]PPE79555.1 hypothetical protein C3941_10555 [Kaistia algarum]